MRSVPTAPLAASRSSALPPVCSAAARLKASGEAELLDLLLELEEPEDDEEVVVPLVPVAELEDVEAGVGEN